TGIIPPWRLERIKKQMNNNEFMPIRAMMTLTHQQWNKMLSGQNYDQAWSMVHFLAHAEEGKYQDGFVKFIGDVGRGRSWAEAWAARLGPPDEFEKRWRAYWLEQEENPTEVQYVKATAMALTSFLARAQQQKQQYDTFEAFMEAAKAGSVTTTLED